MKIIITALGFIIVSSISVPLAVAAAVLPSELSGPAATAPVIHTPTVGADFTLDARAAAVCPGLSWAVLAAIASIESASGASTLPGVHSGHNAAGAEGPMQFEPATFAAYDRPVPPGGADPPSPYDPIDATYAAARVLCANGAATISGLPGALYAYNHSEAYVAAVLTQAQSDESAFEAPATTVRGARAVAWALAQIGTPYIWGGESPGVGFDCSGLVQAAYAAAGVTLPRVAQDQFDAGPPVPAGATLGPGDLVFFGTGPSAVEHVGLVVAPGVMVDAPHTGADVREEPFPSTLGALWGDEAYLGATRPGP
jgi:cell wall-associated NlpC family hydrolase